MIRQSPFIITAAAILGCLATLPAEAETTRLNTGILPGQVVYDAARATPLALDDADAPTVVLLDIDAGVVVPPHAAPGHPRLVSVLSGTLYFGDGDVVLPDAEMILPAGSVVYLPAGQMHWAAAREGAVRLQLVVLDRATPVAAVLEQLQ